MRSVARATAASPTVAEWSGNSVVHTDSSPARSARRAASTVSSIVGSERTTPIALTASLPQPRRFEGLRTVEVLNAASGPAVPEGVDVRQLHLEGSPACCSVGDEADPEEHSVTLCLGVQRLDPKIGVRVKPTSPLLPDRLDPRVRGGIWVLARRLKFGVRMPEPEFGHPFPGVEASVRTKHEVHVLLRHRSAWLPPHRRN